MEKTSIDIAERKLAPVAGDRRSERPSVHPLELKNCPYQFLFSDAPIPSVHATTFRRMAAR
jgi:hypothetical protein